MYGPAWGVDVGAACAARRVWSGWVSRLVTASGPTHMGHWKQLRVHLARRAPSARLRGVEGQRETHLFPSLLMLLLGTSNKQLGQ